MRSIGRSGRAVSIITGLPRSARRAIGLQPVTSSDCSLATPVGLKAQYVSGHEVNISWTDVSIVETGYLVEISKEGGSWQTVGTLPKDSNRFTFGGPLDPSSQYDFEFRPPTPTRVRHPLQRRLTCRPFLRRRRNLRRRRPGNIESSSRGTRPAMPKPIRSFAGCSTARGPLCKA